MNKNFRWSVSPFQQQYYKQLFIRFFCNVSNGARGGIGKDVFMAEINKSVKTRRHIYKLSRDVFIYSYNLYVCISIHWSSKGWHVIPLISTSSFHLNSFLGSPAGQSPFRMWMISGMAIAHNVGPVRATRALHIFFRALWSLSTSPVEWHWAFLWVGSFNYVMVSDRIIPWIKVSRPITYIVLFYPKKCLIIKCCQRYYE